MSRLAIQANCKWVKTTSNEQEADLSRAAQLSIQSKDPLTGRLRAAARRTAYGGVAKPVPLVPPQRRRFVPALRLFLGLHA